LVYGLGPYEFPENTSPNQEQFGMNVVAVGTNWDQRHLTEDFISFDPDISADGARIALVKGLGGSLYYSLNKSKTESIYVMDSDGTNVQRLTEGPPENKPQWGRWGGSGTGGPEGPWDSSPVFSPDGEKVAFSRDGGDISSDGIWVVDADGSKEAERIAHVKTDRDYNPMPIAFAPDGERIAYADQEAVWTVGVEGGGIYNSHNRPERLITAEEMGLENILDLEYSPVEQRLAVVGYAQEGDNEGKVIAISPTNPDNPEKTSQTRFEDLTPKEPRRPGVVSWTADGEYIVFKNGTEGMAAVQSNGTDPNVEPLPESPVKAGYLQGIDFGFDWGAYTLDETRPP